MFGSLAVKEIWIIDLSSALVGMLVSSSKLFLFLNKTHLNSGAGLLLELYCFIVVKHIAFFTICMQLTMAFTFNACVAHGGWVPRNLGAGAADPNPGSRSTPKACPTRNKPQASPAIPSPSPSTRHTEPEAPWK